MEYIVDNNKYILNYQELKNDYLFYKSLSDKEFLNNIIKIIHFCCMVSYLKNLPTSCVLIDNGIIHELIHLLDDNTKDEAINRLLKIRNLFNELMELN